jgi:hypothetical protein
MWPALKDYWHLDKIVFVIEGWRIRCTFKRQQINSFGVCKMRAWRLENGLHES